MKKFIITLLLLTLSTGLLYAQGFQFYRTSPPIVYGDTGYTQATVTKAVIKNTSSSDINIRFYRALNQLPGPTWESSLCVGTNCYASFLDTVPPYNQQPYILSPGATDTLSIDVYGLTVGQAKIIIKAYLRNNPSVYLTDTFRVQLGPVGIQRISSEVTNYNLYQNYPNPFNPVTSIKFSIAGRDNVKLGIYDMLGNEITSLINNETLEAGTYETSFSAQQFGLTSGVYFYRLTTNKFSSVKRMILLK